MEGGTEMVAWMWMRGKYESEEMQEEKEKKWGGKEEVRKSR